MTKEEIMKIFNELSEATILFYEASKEEDQAKIKKLPLIRSYNWQGRRPIV